VKFGLLKTAAYLVITGKIMHPTLTVQLDLLLDDVDIFLFAEKFNETFLEYISCSWPPAEYRI